jgi:hypothetical protein
MIKSYECNPDYNVRFSKYVGVNHEMLKEYSKLYDIYDRIYPEYKIKVQIAKCNVWNIEINSIKSLLESAKINEVEKLLLEDHKNTLQKEAWECCEELYRIYHEELSQVYPNANEFLVKIEGACIGLEKPVTRHNFDFEKYIKLSPTEKIRLRIAQSGMLNTEKFALGRRKRSLKIDIFEKMFLNYRIQILDDCVWHNSNCIRHIFCEELPRGSSDVEEIYEEMIKALNLVNKTYLTWRYRNNLEYYKYPYDFERPSDTSPVEWGSPLYKWKTG